jgi:hypothetical protein
MNPRTSIALLDPYTNNATDEGKGRSYASSHLYACSVTLCRAHASSHIWIKGEEKSP